MNSGATPRFFALLLGALLQAAVVCAGEPPSLGLPLDCRVGEDCFVQNYVAHAGVDFTCGAWGARPWADGLDGNSHMFANMASHSIEVTEAEEPIQLLAYEFVADKAGAGKYRGGVPFRRDYRFLEEEGTLQVRSDRRDHRPFGLYGGSPGGPSENYFNPQAENRVLPGKFTMIVKRGDIFRHVLAGAGGWGDPLERDPAAVLKDVRMREQAGEIQKTVGLLLDDVRRLGDRVEKLKGHFAATEKDLRDVDISADRITKRGQRILDVDLGEEPPALPNAGPRP